ncbi:hypothetical protein HQQ81_13110 [Microbacteriaceae bacterium VKM Ac-2854]|nr:hypothetical protein [Microbacteriaceae bacterium VKM Ac-2854]
MHLLRRAAVVAVLILTLSACAASARPAPLVSAPPEAAAPFATDEEAVAMASGILSRLAEVEEVKHHADAADYSMFVDVTTSDVAHGYQDDYTNDRGEKYVIDGRSAFDAPTVVRRWTGSNGLGHLVVSTCIDRGGWRFVYPDGRLNEAAEKRRAWTVSLLKTGDAWLITRTRATDRPGC